MFDRSFYICAAPTRRRRKQLVLVLKLGLEMLSMGKLLGFGALNPQLLSQVHGALLAGTETGRNPAKTCPAPVEIRPRGCTGLR